MTAGVAPCACWSRLRDASLAGVTCVKGGAYRASRRPIALLLQRAAIRRNVMHGLSPPAALHRLRSCIGCSAKPALGLPSVASPGCGQRALWRVRRPVSELGRHGVVLPEQHAHAHSPRPPPSSGWHLHPTCTGRGRARGVDLLVEVAWWARRGAVVRRFCEIRAPAGHLSAQRRLHISRAPGCDGLAASRDGQERTESHHSRPAGQQRR
jgi:hypothetical protein